MFRRKKATGTSHPAGKPASIYHHILAHIPEDGPGLSDGGEDLPDTVDDGGVKWAPGAQDGTLVYHWGGRADDEEVRRLTLALRKAATADGHHADAAFEELCETAREATVVAAADPVLTSVRETGLAPEACYRVAYRLATEGRYREPVKLGIALLGLFDAGLHRDELLVLGRHEEFTLFAAVALSSTEDRARAEADLWWLARRVEGWGRVHLVDRLAGATDPGLREWLLREGFRNDVDDSYTAVVAAQTGGLADALAGDPDDELLLAAADLLRTLVSETVPVRGMPDYADGKRATSLFLDHMASRASDLRHFLAVLDLRRYAEREWPDLVPRCAQILDRPLWADLARRGLASQDATEYFRAVQVGDALGLRTLETHLDRLRNGAPFDATAWSAALKQIGPETADEVFTLAAELLPLDEIASGPAEELGFGEEFAPHHALDLLLHELGKWPGKGVPLVHAALSSPVTRNRNLVIRTLDAWGRDAWPPRTAELVAAALEREPDGDVRGRFRALLDGRPIE